PRGAGMLTAFTGQDGTLRRKPGSLGGAQWIDLLSPTPEEAEEVARATGLAVPSEADISEIESSSRLSTRDGALYLSMPMVARPETEPRSVSIGFVLTPERLLTIRFAPSRVFDHFMERPVLPAHSSSHILVGLLEALVDRQADALEQVKAELETISH